MGVPIAIEAVVLPIGPMSNKAGLDHGSVTSTAIRSHLL